MSIKALFLDLGGVLLTNGWDHISRQKAIDQFHIEEAEFNFLHKKFYDQHEKGEMTLDHYLEDVVFWRPRSFTSVEFKEFMYAQSKPNDEMIDFVKEIKAKHGWKIAVVSNEGRELAEYRIKTFALTSIADVFFVSSFVHAQKPDPFIFQIALDVLQLKVADVFYLDDRSFLIEAAEKLGIKGSTFTTLENLKTTCPFLL